MLFDISQRQTRASTLSGPNGESVLLFTEVRNIGADVAVVGGPVLSRALPGRIGLTHCLRLSELINLNLVRADGTVSVHIEEVEIEPAARRITELTVHSGGVLGIGPLDTRGPAETVRGVSAELVSVEMTARSKQPADQRMRTFDS